MHPIQQKWIKIISIILMLVSMMLPLKLYAWSAAGHEIVDEIAYRLLKPEVRRQVISLSYLLNGDSVPYNFRTLGTWPDAIKQQGVTAFNAWHFINFPYSLDKQNHSTVTAPNAAWAFLQAQQVLQSDNAQPYLKAMFLAFFIHLAGDLHQPMHCINLFSKQFPQGDDGGNSFAIHYYGASNLHELWDDGLGTFRHLYQDRQLQSDRIDAFANRLMQLYPPQYFGDKIRQTDPWTWAHESYQLARDVAYQIQPGAKPTREYLEAGRTLVYQQLTLAGYRLAYLLNQLMVQPVRFNQRLSLKEQDNEKDPNYRRR